MAVTRILAFSCSIVGTSHSVNREEKFESGANVNFKVYPLKFSIFLFFRFCPVFLLTLCRFYRVYRRYHIELSR